MYWCMYVTHFSGFVGQVTFDICDDIYYIVYSICMCSVRVYITLISQFNNEAIKLASLLLRSLVFPLPHSLYLSLSLSLCHMRYLSLSESLFWNYKENKCLLKRNKLIELLIENIARIPLIPCNSPHD